MSKETSKWLNFFILVGHALKRGTAWHYRKEDQGAEPNHYDGAIPVSDVLRRLFNFTVVDTPLYIAKPSLVLGNDGTPVEVTEYVEVEGRKAMVTSDDFTTLGIFKSGYAGHQYPEWLLGNVANILGGDVGIGGAGLLRNRAQAYVQVEVPDSVHDDRTGLDFRPQLLACTSFDGTLATTYKRTVQVVVCDNTLSAGLSEHGETFKIKHSKNSILKIADAQEALSLIGDIADDFTSELAKLSQTEVTEAQWQAVVEALVPEGDSKRSVTMSAAKRDQLNDLYRFDARAATWAGTALGVLQAFNTWEQHYKATKATTERAERNMVEALSGKLAESDGAVLETLSLVLSNV